jgi:hypothetical protein
MTGENRGVRQRGDANMNVGQLGDGRSWIGAGRSECRFARRAKQGPAEAGPQSSEYPYAGPMAPEHYMPAPTAMPACTSVMA